MKNKIIIFIVLFMSTFFSCFSHSDPFWDIVEIKSELKIEKNKIFFKDTLSLPLNDRWKTNEEIIEITKDYYNKNYFINHKNKNCDLEITKVSNNWEHTFTEWLFLCEKEILWYEELYIKNSLFIDYPYRSWNIFLKINQWDNIKNIIFTDTDKEFIWTESIFLKKNVEKKEISIDDYKKELKSEEENNYLVVINKFIKLWIDHILDGIDHILFIIVLVLTTFKFRNIVFLITGFTISHSITIILAWMWLISLTWKIVEPIIAGSIIVTTVTAIYMNYKKNTDKNMNIYPHSFIIFIFGLFHGLGFAGAFSALNIESSNYLLPLIFMNIGVELGQLFILMLAFPIIWILRNQKYGYILLHIFSFVTIGFAVLWLLERV